MSEIKHTPGPWSIKTRESRYMPGVIIQDGVCGPDGEQIKVEGVTLSSCDEAKANARLIAAAPELLGALLALDDLRGSWSPPDDVIKAAWSKCRAAIAKATGEQA